MRICLVSPEFLPFASAGSLAETTAALSRQLQAKGHELTVILPKYRQVSDGGYGLTETGLSLRIPVGWREAEARIFQATTEEGVRVFFVANEDYYGREGLYGTGYGAFEDNAERFVFFCRAVLELCVRLNLVPQVFHCHDWPAAMVPVYLRTVYSQRPELKGAAVLFTVHDFGYQGIFPPHDFSLTGLSWELFTPGFLEFYGQLNLLKGGLRCADLINTVSPAYREEVLTEEFGFGLEGVLGNRRDVFYGIMNGVDHVVWDPGKDPHLGQGFTEKNLLPKVGCKRHLQELVHLEVDAEAPLAIYFGQFSEAQGIHLVCALVSTIVEQGCQLLIAGTGEEKDRDFLRTLVGRYPGRVAFHYGTEEAFVHRLYAGADIFLNPAQYQPCGTPVLQAMAYGVVPVIRAVGGLKGVVGDYDENPEQGKGFCFADFSPEAMSQALTRALEVYKDRAEWSRLMRRVMEKVFCWEDAAEAYLDLYQKAVSIRENTGGG